MHSIRPYVHGDRCAWNAFVRASKNGTFLFDRNYMEYHHDRFIDASLVIANGDGQLVALFPANRSEDRIVSHGGLTYGGIISDGSMTTTQMVDIFADLRSYLRADGVRTVNYKTVPTIYHRMPSDEDRYALFVHGAAVQRRDVISVVEMCARGPLQKRRVRGATRAEKAGVSVGRSSDFAAFWHLLADNLMERHDKVPVHSLAELELLHSRFPANITLMLAQVRGSIVAGVLLYITEETAHAQYIASSTEGRSIGALDMLFIYILDEVKYLKRFSFGISTETDGTYLNRGLVDFKEGFGARAVVHDHYRWTLE